MVEREKVVACLKENLMNFLLLCGVLVGIILGLILQAAKESYTQREIMYVGFLGELLLHMLKAVALPLMVCSLVTAVGTLDMHLSGRLGGELVLFIILTKIQVLIMAIAFALIFQPGSYVPTSSTNIGDEEYEVKRTAVDGFLDIIRNMFPSNVIEMALKYYSTVLERKNDSTDDLTTWDVKDGGEMLEGVNMIGVVTVSILVGVALGLMQQSGLPLLSFFECFYDITMLITLWIMWIAPVCITCLIAQQVLQMRESGEIISNVGFYLGLLILLYLIQFFIVYPIIYVAFVRKLPFKFIWNFSEALVTAFGTASSNACIPLSIKCLIEKNKMDPRLVQFVISFGANINKDGSAIFYSLSTIFIAQLNNRYLTFGDLMVVALLSAGASIATIGIPASSVLALVLLFSTLDLPFTDISLFLALDWFSDRFQTPVNILGDAIAAAVLNALNKQLFEPTDVQEEELKEITE